MRWLALGLIFAGSVCFSGCGGALRSQERPPEKWSTGFWYWQGSSPGDWPASQPLDELYLQVGSIVPGFGPSMPAWSVYAGLPKELPPAREYWLVIRCESQKVPDLKAAGEVARRTVELVAESKVRHWNVAGLQLDIDSPTRSLPEYAEFLKEVRKNLPPGVGLSITALLDWFRDGTAIRDVIQQVDEFVPQFYDQSRPGMSTAIGGKIDAARWAPAFNSYGKRFRIGISSFGRAEFGDSAGRPYEYADVAPLAFASNPAFNLETSIDPVGELVLGYRATRDTTINYSRFQPGQSVRFILPTAESIRSAVAAAKKMGPRCAGVLFFRWPTDNETLVMAPPDVLAAAGGRPDVMPAPPSIKTFDGGCAAVNCADVFFFDPDPLRPATIRFRIHSSSPLEYFLPEERIPIRMTGPSELELSLPAYGSQRRMLLGRAVSQARAGFTVEEMK